MKPGYFSDRSIVHKEEIVSISGCLQATELEVHAHAELWSYLWLASGHLNVDSSIQHSFRIGGRLVSWLPSF